MNIPKARKLPSGSWFVQLRIRGESISITRPTEGQAIAEAIAIKEGMKDAPKKKSSEESVVTLSDAIDKYIASRDNTISPATIAGYRVIQSNRFREIMGRDVKSLDEDTLQLACNLEATRCAAKTIENAWGLVSSVLKRETGRSFSVQLPQVIRNEHAFLDSEEIVIFLDAIRGDKAEIAALLALHSLRRSELLALTWDNVDLKRQIIHVRGSMVENEYNKMVIKKENKNSPSQRDLPIMIPRLIELLEAEPEKAGIIVKCKKHAILDHINKACRKAGLPAVGIHGLRHSFASLAYSVGMPEKDTMKLGGWSDEETMRKIYTHVAARDLAKHQNRMAAFYSDAANKNANDS